MTPSLRTRTLFATVIVTLFIVAGCSESPTGSGVPAGSKTAFLTAKTWKTKKFTYDSGVDGTAFFQTFTRFNTDGTMNATFSVGAPKNGTWAFNVDTTSITITNDTNVVNWNILTLSESSLHLKANLPTTIWEWEGEPQ